MLNRLRPYQITLIVAVVYLLIVLIGSGGDVLEFVTIGNCYAACNGQVCALGAGEEVEGYDGQFAYYIARDPLNAAPCIDVPAYRYQRILLPALGALVTLSTDALIPVAFVLIQLSAHVAAVALLERLLADLRVSRWYALVYGLFPGLLLGIRLSTSEPLAYALCIAAIYFHTQIGKTSENPTRLQTFYSLLPAIFLALAALAKETALLFTAGFGLYALLRRDIRGLISAITAVIPFALWQLVLNAWFGSFGVGSGGAGGTPFEIVPFAGVGRMISEGVITALNVGNSSGALAITLLVLIALFSAALPALWGVWASARQLISKGVQLNALYAYLLLINALVLWFVPFSTYREPLGLLRFLPGLVLAHLLFAAQYYRARRPLQYTFLWLILLLFLR